MRCDTHKVSTQCTCHFVPHARNTDMSDTTRSVLAALDAPATPELSNWLVCRFFAHLAPYKENLWEAAKGIANRWGSPGETVAPSVGLLVALGLVAIKVEQRRKFVSGTKDRMSINRPVNFTIITMSTHTALRLIRANIDLLMFGRNMGNILYEVLENRPSKEVLHLYLESVIIYSFLPNLSAACKVPTSYPDILLCHAARDSPFLFDIDIPSITDLNTRIYVSTRLACYAFLWIPKKIRLDNLRMEEALKKFNAKTSRAKDDHRFRMIFFWSISRFAVAQRLARSYVGDPHSVVRFRTVKDSIPQKTWDFFRDASAQFRMIIKHFENIDEQPVQVFNKRNFWPYIFFGKSVIFARRDGDISSNSPPRESSTLDPTDADAAPPIRRTLDINFKPICDAIMTDRFQSFDLRALYYAIKPQTEISLNGDSFKVRTLPAWGASPEVVELSSGNGDSGSEDLRDSGDTTSEEDGENALTRRQRQEAVIQMQQQEPGASPGETSEEEEIAWTRQPRQDPPESDDSQEAVIQMPRPTRTSQQEPEASDPDETVMRLGQSKLPHTLARLFLE